jgi:hypothetical protein
MKIRFGFHMRYFVIPWHNNTSTSYWNILPHLRLLPRVEQISEIGLTVNLPSFFILWQKGAHIFDRDLLRRDGHAQVPGASQHIAVTMPVFSCLARIVILSHTGLGDLLVDDPVQLLVSKDVVISMEYGADMVFHQ